ncbi:MAG: class I SAM-dependent methyltransferase [Magnetococcales bacterium]|nr:class I SAM-dependent methyltransferase [Magnetococcales bacterium]
MLKQVDFISTLHNRTKRDYRQRVLDHDKAECAVVACQWGEDYWDGERQFGYGGYRYDGRWRGMAEKLAQRYGLRAGDRILDVGCGKAYLLYELTQVVPGVEVVGFDLSEYGLTHAKEELSHRLVRGHASSLPFADNAFDLVISVITLHNLPCFDLERAIREIQRVGRGTNRYIAVESFRNEREKVNLLYWQLTCRSFYSPEEWAWWYRRCGYTGDYDFIFFE